MTAWHREQAADGRVYFFNIATGASQWHIPNDLYQPKHFGSRPGAEDPSVMPSSARALHGVDCVTETVPRGSTLASMLKRRFMAGMENGVAVEIEQKGELSPVVPPRAMLQLTLVSAKGLRDADFMPGRDKSDPYCVVQVVGKKDSAFRTHVVQDCLDPVWNYTELLDGWSQGDVVRLTVWDQDETDALKRNQDILGKAVDKQAEGEPRNPFTDMDTHLGRLDLGAAETERLVADPDRPGTFTLQEAGQGITASLCLRASLLHGWPSFVGTPISEAQFDIERAVPGFDVQPLEMHGLISGEVVAWDPLHARHGYCGNFFGAYLDQASRLQEGDVVDVGSTRFTFTHLDDDARGEPRNPSELIVHVYVLEDIDGAVFVGEPWCKVTRQPQPGHRNDRVYVFYEPGGKTVCQMPVIG